jgi:DNA-binding IclR family transcriptional regulator
MPSNVFSVSAATGIPRETVRRKTQRLCEQGLLERIGRKLYVTAKFLSLARSKREGLASKLRMMARIEPVDSRVAVLPQRSVSGEGAKASL